VRACVAQIGGGNLFDRVADWRHSNFASLPRRLALGAGITADCDQAGEVLRRLARVLRRLAERVAYRHAAGA